MFHLGTGIGKRRASSIRPPKTITNIGISVSTLIRPVCRKSEKKVEHLTSALSPCRPQESTIARCEF
jgi:hypothetical protein